MAVVFDIIVEERKELGSGEQSESAQEMEKVESGAVEVIEPCWRRRVDGKPCGRAGMAPTGECMEHFRWHLVVPDALGMPLPEDAVAVEEILRATLAKLIMGNMDPAIGCHPAPQSEGHRL